MSVHVSAIGTSLDMFGGIQKALRNRQNSAEHFLEILHLT